MPKDDRFNVSTIPLLKRYGHHKVKRYSHKLPTIQEAWDGTTDKNWRYALRLKLLRLGGYIP